MKRASLIILIVVAIGCKDSERKRTSEQTWNRTDPIWEYQLDSSAIDFRLVKLRDVSADTLTVPLVEQIVNTAWPDVRVKYFKTSRDTVFVAIPASEVLTQQMGSSGPQQFLASATFTFTELKGINYVSYSFAPGDHAQPGVYSRKSWPLTDPNVPNPLP